jgi:hypothetical protein
MMPHLFPNLIWNNKNSKTTKCPNLHQIVNLPTCPILMLPICSSNNVQLIPHDKKCLVGKSSSLKIKTLF